MPSRRPLRPVHQHLLHLVLLTTPLTRRIGFDAPSTYQMSLNRRQLACPCSGNACIILLHLINPVLHVLLGRLSLRWSSPGLTPFLGRPGLSGHFCTSPAGGHLTPTYNLSCNRPNARQIFSRIGFRA
ncbi:hypothetical protein AVEN_177703-1 [Araneus ventricosus]|uniref:Uncharacterized protein n=1 Tax=Araneus ventricosus TaxID=182803 RepID=A0A4Y2QSQ2_ARAVE|nr:hypothetical protein AVEN_177703-1 [Araneus ventricosus]